MSLIYLSCFGSLYVERQTIFFPVFITSPDERYRDLTPVYALHCQPVSGPDRQASGLGDPSDSEETCFIIQGSLSEITRSSQSPGTGGNKKTRKKMPPLETALKINI